MPATDYANTTAPVDDRLAPPANIHAEKTIFGAILLDNFAWSEVAERLVAEDFSLDSHQRVFSAMQKMIADGRTVDLITLGEQMRGCWELEAVGGVAFLASLTEGLPRRPAIGEYIGIVLEKSGLRQLAELGQKTVNTAYGQAQSVGGRRGDCMTERMQAFRKRVDQERWICPNPQPWNALWEMLPDRKRAGSGWIPALPLILAAWWDIRAYCETHRRRRLPERSLECQAPGRQKERSGLTP